MTEIKATRRSRSQLRRFLELFRVTKEGATPIKWEIVIIVTLALFGTSFILTFPFAFLPFMVLHFGYREEDKGYYAGIIASSYFFGRIFGSFFWGWLSDKKGRRVVMLINLAMNALLCPPFGFSTSLLMACMFRFLIGLMTGVLTCTKTILYEISDNTNQAFGMSCIGVSWGLGSILGPAVGGFLSSPASKYPDFFPQEGFFVQFPFLLPCLVATFVNLLGFILVFVKLPETLQKKKKAAKTEKNNLSLLEKQPNDKDNLTRISAEIMRGNEQNAMQSLDNMAMLFSTLDIEDTSLYRMKSEAYVHYLSYRHLNIGKTHSRENVAVDNSVTKLRPMRRKMSLSAPDLSLRSPQLEGATQKEMENFLDKEDDRVVIEINEEEDRGCCQGSTKCVLFRLFRNSDVRTVLVGYTLFSYCVIGYEEILSVWASTKVKFDGLDFSSDKLGMLAVMVAVPLLILQIFIFSKIEAKVGVKKMMLGATFLVCLGSMVSPILHFLHDRHELLWFLLFLLLTPMRIAVLCTFTGFGIFMNNAVSPAMAGSVNGLGLTFSAVARTLAPMAGGSLFAWSITSGLPYPFDVNCAFLMFTICYTVSFVFILLTPERLNLQSKRLKIEEINSNQSLHGENGDVVKNAWNKESTEDSKERLSSVPVEENRNGTSLEWFLKEGQEVAIVERNLSDGDGKGKSTAL